MKCFFENSDSFVHGLWYSGDHWGLLASCLQYIVSSVNLIREGQAPPSLLHDSLLIEKYHGVRCLSFWWTRLLPIIPNYDTHDYVARTCCVAVRLVSAEKAIVRDVKNVQRTIRIIMLMFQPVNDQYVRLLLAI